MQRQIVIHTWIYLLEYPFCFFMRHFQMKLFSYIQAVEQSPKNNLRRKVF